MGTRGFVGVAIDDNVKISYNHWDSYPGGIGVTVLAGLRKTLQDDGLASLTQKARDLKMVDEDAQPTAEEIAGFKSVSDPNVGGSIDQPTDGAVHNYYQLLRGLQGDLFGMLDAGLATDAHDFYLDSLFCEWGYLVDLDAGTLQVYQGFQSERHDQGRWAGQPTDEQIQTKVDGLKEQLDKGEINEGQFAYWSKTEYHSVKLVGEWPLDALPEEDAFLAKVEPQDDED